MGCRRGEVLGKGDNDKHADCSEVLTRGCIKV